MLTVQSGTCSLQYFTDIDDLDLSLERMKVSEDAVAYEQAEEDLRLYGSRPVPFHLCGDWDMDDPSGIPLPPSKRPASDFEEIGHPSKVSKSKSNGLEISRHEGVVTTLDWNSGASPLESWLNQSAIPSILPPVVDKDQIFSHDDLIKQEEDEIKAFRSVHIKMTPNPPSADLNMKADEHFAASSLGAQIHYRNIKDKYPLVPSYLASRLAEANVQRAERLQRKRLPIDGRSCGQDTLNEPRKRVRPRCSYCRTRNV